MDHSVFPKNRDRLREHEVVETFSAEVMDLTDRSDADTREGNAPEADISSTTARPTRSLHYFALRSGTAGRPQSAHSFAIAA